MLGTVAQPLIWTTLGIGYHLAGVAIRCLDLGCLDIDLTYGLDVTKDFINFFKGFAYKMSIPFSVNCVKAKQRHLPLVSGYATANTIAQSALVRMKRIYPAG